MEETMINLLCATLWHFQTFHLNSRWWTICVLCLFVFHSVGGDMYESSAPHGQQLRYTEAIVNITYKNPKTGDWESETINGRYGLKSLIESETGILVHVRTFDPKSGMNISHGCQEKYDNEIPSERWIALIERGACPFSEKIEKATKHYNASAVVIYNENNDEQLVSMDGLEPVNDVVAVFIQRLKGLHLAKLADKGHRVVMRIIKGQFVTKPNATSSISKTSVLFVSISFIVLMIISLAWLVFYYIQRFRYAHAKERLSRRLASAAKKAISKIPQRTIKQGDKELGSDSDQCAVCIESYKNNDVIRTLPCKHVYHKSCVDPWLMDQRSCPMCKLDILRAYGMQIHLHGSQDSMVPPDPESGTVSGVMDEVEPSSSPDELGAVGGVKIVHFSHPSIQYHPTSLPLEVGCSNEEGISSSSCSNFKGKRRSCDSRTSHESAHFSDSECNELQSLMTPTRKLSTSRKDSSSSLPGQSYS